MIRVAIVDRMGELGWTAYRLAKAVEGLVTAPPVYDFVAGRKDLKGTSLNHILRALGLEIAPAKTPHGIPDDGGAGGKPRKRSQTRRKAR